MKKITLAYIFFFGLLSACKKDPFQPVSNNPGNPGNTGNPGPVNKKRPVANAGPDQTILLPKHFTSLDGSGSYDPDSAVINYRWRLLSGPGGTDIASADNKMPVIFNLTEGQYSYELKVYDQSPDSVSFDTTNVNVVKPTYCPTNRAEIYPQLIQESTLPLHTVSPEIVAAGNKLIIPQGFIDYLPVTAVSIYDRSTMTWSTAQLSEARLGMAIIASGNYVFFAGGMKYNSDFYFSNTAATVDIYDAAANTWSVATLSEARGAIKAVVSGNRIYFAGGIKSDRSFSSTVDIYDRVTGTWSTTYFPGEPRALIGAVATQDKLCFSGGFTEFADYTGWGETFGKPVRDIDMYDLTTGQWTRDSMERAKAYFATLANNGKVYMAGGYTFPDGFYHFDVEVLDVATLTKTTSCLFQANTFATKNITSHNGQLLFIGEGNFYGAVANRMDIFDTQTGVWKVGIMPPVIDWSAYFTTITSVSGKVYVVSGDKLYEMQL